MGKYFKANGTIPVNAFGSFPSAHAVQFSIGFAMLMKFLDSKGGWRYFLHVVCVLMPFGVGITRIIDHMHSPVDVLAGWVAGYMVASYVYAECTIPKKDNQKENIPL